MVNTEKFAKRLHKILEYYDLSAASFADKIEVGRSSISHILSGRNKPSLEFVMKIVKTFPEVELYWLLNGKGNFPQENKTASTPSQEFQFPNEEISKKQVESDSAKNNLQSISNSIPPPTKGKAIRKIVIFYNDGTFDAFEN